MRLTFLSWACENHSFWNLPCYACDSCLGWRVTFCERRRNSYIAAAHCKKCNAKQFLKKGRSDQHDISLEYQFLKDLNGGFQMQSGHFFSLPHAYHFSDVSNGFSREFLDGASMLERILCSGTKQALKRCLSASAIWLKGLHEAPIKHYCRPGGDYVTMLGRLELDYSRFEKVDSTVKLALKLMRSILRKFKDTPEENVPIHGDYKASNLIVIPTGKIYGIDLSPRFMNPGTMDIAQFITNLLLERNKIKALKSSNDIAYIIDIFLDAYNGNSNPSNKLSTKWWILYFIISNWLIELESYKPRLLVSYKFKTILEDVITYHEADPEMV
jgi:hypothetical protein